MNILYIAYSCSPNKGSEDKIGWNVPMTNAKTHQVIVITKEEQRKHIESYLQNNPAQNIRFFYVDIPAVYKKVFAGPFYSGRLNIWNRRALRLVKELCKKEKIDVIHQIAPIEFRSIGNYGRISDVPFVCGPIGGGEYIPEGLRAYAKGHRLTEWVRLCANYWYRFWFGVTKKLHACDKILFANRETMAFLQKQLPVNHNHSILTEVGTDSEELAYEEQPKTDNKCRFLVAGRLVYRKGHAFLLDALERIPNDLEYECRIVGKGPEMKNIQEICASSPKLSRHVTVTGAVPYAQMAEEYANADVFIMPSLRETTGSVLLEALSQGVPVVTIDRFGGAVLLNEDTGWRYSGNTREEYIENLKETLISCIQNPDEVRRKSENARSYAMNYTWQEKCRYYDSIYRELIKETGE